VRGELPGQSARGHGAANPCGSLQGVSERFLLWMGWRIEDISALRLCGIIWLCLIAMLLVGDQVWPRLAVVVVFEVAGRLCRRRSRPATRTSKEKSSVWRSVKSWQTIEASLR